VVLNERDTGTKLKRKIENQQIAPNKKDDKGKKRESLDSLRAKKEFKEDSRKITELMQTQNA